MNILLISRCPAYPLYLGDRLIVYHLARELSRRGHVIDILAFSNRVEDLAEREEYAGFFRSVTLIPEPPRSQLDLILRAIKVRPRFATTADQAWSPEMGRAIEGKLRENHYDVAHVFGGIHVYEYAPLLGKLPAIITPYESYALFLRRVMENSKGLRGKIGGWAAMQIARIFEKFMFEPYRAVVVVSPVDGKELTQINPQLNIRVIPNGCAFAQFSVPMSGRDQARIVFTGNYEYAPNVDAAKRLINRVLPNVRTEFPDAKVWIVGNAPPSELKALESEHVTVTGRVPDIGDYLNRAGVYVSALRIGAGIKNKILEALANGIPVVGTAISFDGIDVVNGESALIADSDDAIAESVVRVMGDAALRDRMGTAGRALIEARYTWSAAADAYEGLYAGGERPHPPSPSPLAERG